MRGTPQRTGFCFVHVLLFQFFDVDLLTRISGHTSLYVPSVSLLLDGLPYGSRLNTLIT
jgi:hypothetical protein